MSEVTVDRANSTSSLPGGTVTFLFTDIEGSTQRWEHHRTAMQAAVQRHDELVRRAIESYGGSVFKTVGDAFYAVFELAPSAAQAAAAVQTAIQRAPFEDVGGLAVRIALHTGNADERGHDYFGPALNRVSRLLSIGHGGQTLLSSVTVGLIDGQLPPSSSLYDLGTHRLKDLERPEHVYQLTIQGGRRDFPPLRSLDATPNNLPLQLTSFVERDNDIAEITGLLDQHRLVTLVGAGGVGKTRISLQVGANLIDRYEDGVWFVELAPLTDSALVSAAVASTLGVTLSAGNDAVVTLVSSLQSKRMLIILDNCEHLVNAASAIASAIAHKCPRVSILASSRQALGIVGEVPHRIPSLLVPNPADIATLRADDVSKYGALSLFVARAQTADSRLTITDANAPIIGEICRRLDGIALAIELAAPRVKILSLADLRDRLNERFRMLTGGSRDLLPRQQTLRAAIDWSFDLLEISERRLFIRLGIFVDSFTFEASAAVCNIEALDEFDFLETLSSLVDKSLVIVNIDGPSARYRLLETTRSYAREKLLIASEIEHIADRHLAYYQGLFRRTHEEANYNPKVLASVFDELENARAAIDWAVRGGKIIDAATVLASSDVWLQHGLNQECIERVEAILPQVPDLEHGLRAQLWSLLDWAESVLGNFDRADKASQEAARLARLTDDSGMIVRLLDRRVQHLVFLKRPLDEAEDILREAEARSDGSLNQKLNLVQMRRELARAKMDWHTTRALSYELSRICHELDFGRGEGWALSLTGEIEFELGNVDEAIAIYQEGLSIDQPSDYNYSLRSVILGMLVLCYAVKNDIAAAKEAARQAISATTKVRDRNSIWASPSFAIEKLAYALALGNQWDGVAKLAGYAAANPVPGERGEREQVEYARFQELLEGRRSSDRFEEQFTEGKTLSRREAIDLALELSTARRSTEPENAVTTHDHSYRRRGP